MKSATPRNPFGSVSLTSSVQDRNARVEIGLKIINDPAIHSTRNVTTSRSHSKPNTGDLYVKGTQENCKCRSCQSKRLVPIQPANSNKSRCGVNESFEIEDGVN